MDDQHLNNFGVFHLGGKVKCSIAISILCVNLQIGALGDLLAQIKISISDCLEKLTHNFTLKF
jgi:hypothetical protein